jgi:amidase
MASVFEFEEATVDALQARMARGETTAVDLASAYLERIAALDSAGPRLNSVIEIDPDALAAATARDAERRAGRVRSRLHGIPVLVKDNVATADRMQTTAGSLALVGARPQADATLVSRLREAGAVLLGKTNLSEWANFRSTSSIGGWSGRGGLTRNPYALDRSASGSSTGSAVATSANLCALAVGTETDGSVVSPASACGVVGAKPTVGLVSRAGVIPISFSQDTPGVFARTVRDAATLLGVLAGADPRDAATAEIPRGFAFDFAARLAPEALRGARLGALRGPFGLHSRAMALFDAALETLRDAGAVVVELGEYAHLRGIYPAEMDVMLYEFKHGVSAYLESLGPESRVRSLADVIAFNEAHAEAEMPYFGQELLLRAQARGTLRDSAYLDARARSLALAREEGLDAMLGGQRLDAVVSLTGGPARLVDFVNGDASAGGSSTLAAVAGYPSVTVPCAVRSGLPVGLSFTGPAWSDGRMLALAAAFEACTQARIAPRFLASVELGR